MAITDLFSDDFEAGWLGAGSGFATDTTDAHTGTQCLSVGGAGTAYIMLGSPPAKVVMSVAVKVAALPAAGQLAMVLALWGDNGNYGAVFVDSTGQLKLHFISSSYDYTLGPTLAPGWHVIECQMNNGSGQTFDWKVDGAPQTPMAVSTSAGAVQFAVLGTWTTATSAALKFDGWKVGSWTATTDWYETWGPTSVELGPAGIGSAGAFGLPIVSGDLLAGGIVSAEAFGLALIDDGRVHPVGIDSGEAFGLPALPMPAVVAPGGIDTGEAFGRAWLHDVGQLITVPGLTSLMTFGDPTLTQAAEQFLAPRGIDARIAPGIPAVALSSAAPVAPAGASSSITFGVPFVLAFAAPEPGRMPALRNLLIDRVTREIYPWPINHATEDPVRTLGRRLTRSGVRTDGRLLSQAAHPGPVHLMLHGSMLDHDQQQYATFVRFFEECDDRTFDYIDASDSYHVAVVGFDARRKNAPSRTDGSYFEYSLECEVLNVNTGALKGYAV